jgi:hypothetical protein
MEFEWDERKRISNAAKHRLDFEDAIEVFSEFHVRLPARAVGDELRHKAIGYVADILVAVIFTERGSAIRIISMRKARNNERRYFHQAL